MIADLGHFSRRLPAILDVADLVGGDDPPEYCVCQSSLVHDQSSAAVVQFQSRISQGIGNPKLREVRANGTNDHSLCSTPLNNETANHHVITRRQNCGCRCHQSLNSHRDSNRTLRREQLHGIVKTTHDRGVISGR